MRNHPPYFRFWAKTDRESTESVPPYHLLAFHGLDVAACAHVLLQESSVEAGKTGYRASLARLLRMDESQVCRFIPFLMALHDFGKFSDGFQNLNAALFEQLQGQSSRADYQMRHDTLGLWLWERELKQVAFEENWFGASEHGVDISDFNVGLRPLILAVMGHHGRPPVQNSQLQKRTHFSPLANAAAKALAREYARILLDGSIWPSIIWVQDEEYIDDFTVEASWLVAGFAVLADWLGSDERIFDFVQSPMPLQDYWQEVALPRARKAVERSGLLGATPAPWRGFDALFSKKSPRPMQVFAQDVEVSDQPQLFILEDATGSGKTEAAIILTNRLMAAGAGRGFYVALPTMATANAMYDRMGASYKAFYQDSSQASLVLAHGASRMHDGFQRSINIAANPERRGQTYSAQMGDSTVTAQCTRWLADNRKKALLAQVGVGTIDQALMAILPASHQSLRMIGLSGKVLIVDEVHAYDPYMHGLLKTLLAFHAAQGGSAILLSATLPQRMRQELCDAFLGGLKLAGRELNATGFPLATSARAVSGSAAVVETPVERLPERAREVAVSLEPDVNACIERILRARRAGQCVCWIRNTVADAIEAHQLLVEHLGEDEAAEDLLLFHARFAMADRQKIERQVLDLFGANSRKEQRARKILVATQVVEQSLDIDFDFMVSDLAPVELLIQRAGRLYRHRREDRPGGAAMAHAHLLIHGPRPEPLPGEEIQADWYASIFPRAAFVYPHVAQLWLSANVLAERGAIRIPAEARLLVESVYSEEAAVCAPRILIEKSAEAEGKDQSDKSMAGFNSLNFGDGYSSESNPDWFDEARTPTRLGDPTVTVRLGRIMDDGSIEPWASDGRHRWALSELNIRAHKIAAADQPGGTLAGAIKGAIESMPDQGKWSILLPLRRMGGDIWQGWALDGRQQRRIVEYSPRFGLQVVEDEMP